MQISLAPDLDRGGHRYVFSPSGEVDEGALRELSDWLDSAKQNPDARFLLDLAGAAVLSRRARLELRALLLRHADLRERRRLSVARPGRAGRTVRVEPRPWPVPA